MKFKLLAVAAAAAVSTNAMALDNSWEFVEELVEEVMSDPFGYSSDIYIDNNDGTTVNVDIDYYTPTLDASILSAAINVEEVNGSVSITGRDVSVTAGAADVSATATADALESVAKATSIVGTDITTLAAGAINSSSVDVSAYQYGEDITIDDQDDTPYAFGEDTFEIDVPYTAVFHGAVNAAAVNASVTIAASAVDGIYHTAGGALALSNLAINTTALGAVNSGVVRIGADLIEAAKVAP